MRVCEDKEVNGLETMEVNGNMGGEKEQSGPIRWLKVELQEEDTVKLSINLTKVLTKSI